VTIYWLPSNGGITQCGRKVHAIKAGRTSRVQHALVQSICQTDNIEDLKTDDIKHKAILAWEQRSPVQNQNNRQQSACRLSAVQRPGPPPQFQQQQQPQQEEQDQGQGQRGGWQGGW